MNLGQCDALVASHAVPRPFLPDMAVPAGSSVGQPSGAVQVTGKARRPESVIKPDTDMLGGSLKDAMSPGLISVQHRACAKKTCDIG